MNRLALCCAATVAVAWGCAQRRPAHRKTKTKTSPAKSKIVTASPAPQVTNAGWPEIEPAQKVELKPAPKPAAEAAPSPKAATPSPPAEPSPAKPAPLVVDFEGPRNYALSGGEPVSEGAISGGKSLFISSYLVDTKWYQFLTTNNGDLRPGYEYTATLKYRVKKAEPNTFLYVLFRSAGKGWGKFDRGWKQVNNIARTAGTVQTHVTKTGLANRYDYQFMVGLNGNAEVIIDDITITPGASYHEDSQEEAFRKKIPADAKRIALLDFEEGASGGRFVGGMGSATRDGAISGASSLLGDSMRKNSTWNVFYESKPGYFKPDNYYYVILKYNVLQTDKRTKFYVLVRSPKGQKYDVILKDWKAPAGASGQFTFRKAVYHPYSDYTLQVGVIGKGKLLVDDIEIHELDRPENLALKNRKPFDRSRAKLVWEENFDGPKLDTSRWKVEGDSPRRGGMWRKANCTVDGEGHFALRFDKSHGKYNGGCIASKKKFKFGYFEARIKLNDYPGHWLGFWLMDGAVNRVGDDGRDGTEIDIVESPWRNKEEVSHALHWDGYGEDHSSIGRHVPAPGLEEGWHTFAVDWFEHGYVFYYDGKETWRTYAGEVCQAPLSILISDELGGWSGRPVDDKLPDHAYVDWVRVYEVND